MRIRRCKRAAVRGAKAKRWVVDMDLEKFFDRVNHDLLMSKLATKIGDARVLTLIRRYLEAGMMADGLVQPRTEGTPQGGPLSPLLSNILLTDLDRELERRGHAFCRYADDCNIYVAQPNGRASGLLAESDRVPRRAAQAQGECGQERGGAAVAAEVSGLQPDVASDAEAAHRGAELSSKLTEKVTCSCCAARAGASLSRTIETLNPVLRGWAAYFKLAETKQALEELRWLDAA